MPADPNSTLSPQASWQSARAMKNATRTHRTFLKSLKQYMITGFAGHANCFFPHHSRPNISSLTEERVKETKELKGEAEN